MGKRRGPYRILVWKPGERDHLENLGGDGSVIFCKLHPIVVYCIRIDVVASINRNRFYLGFVKPKCFGIDENTYVIYFNIF